jgi:hypothetical protein
LVEEHAIDGDENPAWNLPSKRGARRIAPPLYEYKVNCAKRCSALGDRSMSEYFLSFNPDGRYAIPGAGTARYPMFSPADYLPVFSVD